MKSSIIKTALLMLIGVNLQAAIQKEMIHYTLDNGLEALLIENPALPMTGINVVVGAGSAYEDFSTSGMSHLLEHLLFNGTASRTQKELYDDTDRIGAFNNAQTGAYFTNFMMVTPAEHIRQGMEIQADMLFNSTIPEANFIKEKGIILEEISKSLSEPQTQLEQNLNSILYAGHALSLPTLGTFATVESIERDELYSFYKNYYVPNNMRLVVVGNFDPALMRQMIEEIYGKERPGKIVIPDNHKLSVAYDVKNLSQFQAGKSYFRNYDGKQEVLQLIWPLPDALESVALDFLQERLNELAGQFQRQYTEAALNVEMGVLANPVRKSLLTTITFPENYEADYKSVAKEIQNFLEKAEFAVDNKLLEGKANSRLTFFRQNLEKPHMLGIYHAPLIATEGLDKFLSTFEKSEIIRQARQLEQVQISSQAMMIVQRPWPKSRTDDVELQVKTTLLPEKADQPTLIIRQNPASELIAIHYLIKHKAYWQSKYGADAAQILHDCIGQRLENDKNQILAQQFGLNITVNDNPFIPMDDIYLHPDFGYLRFEALSTDIPQLIQFLNTALLNFTPTQEEFARAKNKMGGQLMSRRSDPARDTFTSLVRQNLYQASPFAAGPKELDYETLLTFAKNYFLPANMIISIVSPATPEELAPLFHDFRNSTPQTEKIPIVKTEIALPKKALTIHETVNSSRAYLYWGFAKTISPEDKAPLFALSLLLRDTISFQIREKMGMAYNIDAGIEIADDKALFYISQGSRPENVETLRKVYPDFFKAALFKKTTEADLGKAINMYLGRSQFRRLSSINQAYYLGHSYYFYQDILADENFLKELKKVKLKELQRVAKKYLKVKNPVEIIVQ